MFCPGLIWLCLTEESGLFDGSRRLRKGMAAWCAGESGDGVLHEAVVAGAGADGHRADGGLELDAPEQPGAHRWRAGPAAPP